MTTPCPTIETTSGGGFETDPLWQRIRDHVLDDPASDFNFSQRLARENGWSADHGAVVVNEYRRFMYLIVRTGERLTPSDAVDQAWHQHLTYSRDYWGVFCGQVLGQRVHHGPTRGGQEEARTYSGLYRRTLELYADTFGSPPPVEIWPDERVRFEQPKHVRRVDTSDYLVIRKAPLRAGAVAGGALLLAGCSLAGDALLNWLGEALVGAVVVGLALWVISTLDRKKKDSGGCGGAMGCSGGCGGCGGD